MTTRVLRSGRRLFRQVPFRIAGGLSAACPLLVMPGLLLADGAISNRDELEGRVIVSGGTTEPIRVEAKQARLGQVLDAIATRTGVRLHSATLPDELVSVSCAGSTVRDVVECVLGPDANLIFRNPTRASKADRQGQTPELWVLSKGSRDDQSPAEPAEVQEAQKEAKATMADGRTGLASDKTARLVQRAASEDAAQRLDALSDLAAMGPPDDERVQRTLERALSDENPEARAQAVYGLSRLGGPATATMLQEALRDSDASVRLMAVESVGNDGQGVALLQEALADSDETVSALAAMKLEPVAKTGPTE